MLAEVAHEDYQRLILPHGLIADLLANPVQAQELQICGTDCLVRIVIPNYFKALQKFYGESLIPDQNSIEQESGLPLPFKHFGIELKFRDSTTLYLHNQENQLEGDLKPLMQTFGAVILKNVVFESSIREEHHRNRFPHLKFHRDRTEHQPTRYSMYSRDPLDEEQRKPRSASTLFMPNILAYIQAKKEGRHIELQGQGVLMHYHLFEERELLTEEIGKVIVEHRWNEPEGCGEVSMLDNKDLLHASYYHDAMHSGYRISVRYLC